MQNLVDAMYSKVDKLQIDFVFDNTRNRCTMYISPRVH